MSGSNAEKITQSFNGTVQWDIGGAGYFKLMSTVNPVKVELYKAGRRVLLADQVEGGFYQWIDFDQVKITTSALEQVAYQYAPAEGGSDRFTGAISVLQGTTITNVAEKTIGVAESAAAAASVNRKSLRFRAPATNTDNIYVGATGITTANGCIEIKPGETWVESDGAAAAWFAISGTAGQKLRVQEVA